MDTIVSNDGAHKGTSRTFSTIERPVRGKWVHDEFEILIWLKTTAADLSPRSSYLPGILPPLVLEVLDKHPDAGAEVFSV